GLRGRTWRGSDRVWSARDSSFYFETFSGLRGRTWRGSDGVWTTRDSPVYFISFSSMKQSFTVASNNREEEKENVI
ncbi:hypothetical protein KSS87_000303, partial [Heliosperma pusillum]